jgi:hypothetical protein
VTILEGKVVPGTSIKSEKVRIRYGPFSVVGDEVLEPKALLQIGTRSKGKHTSLTAFVKKPCTNCTIIAMQAGMETADGKDANVDRGYMLHHSMLLNEGPGRSDVTCNFTLADLFHALRPLKMKPLNVERLFPSGNERTPLDFTTAQKVKAGYFLKMTDSFHIVTEIMNMTPDPVELYTSYTYEYIPGPLPVGWHSARPLTVDVGNCSKSAVPSKPEASYDLVGQPWTSNIDGYILGAGGHVHDGGTDITLFQNNKTICRSTFDYGTNPSYVQGMVAMNDTSINARGSTPGANAGMVGMTYISKTSLCTDIGYFKKGDRMQVIANYNTTAHMPMKADDGEVDEVMGLMIVYIATPI